MDGGTFREVFRYMGAHVLSDHSGKIAGKSHSGIRGGVGGSGGEDGGVTSIAVDVVSGVVITGGGDGTVRLWDRVV